jgi:hypothetical protein
MIARQKTITGEAPPTVWREVKETHKTARKFADRHYSRKTPGSSHFMGPGQTLVLLSTDDTALFGWRVQEYRKDEQQGIECNIFRNEGPHLSSELILEAEKWAIEKWPGARRLFTMVDSKKIRRKRDPGRCFRKAGWSPCGISKDRGLIILEKPLPESEIEGD